MNTRISAWIILTLLCVSLLGGSVFSVNAAPSDTLEQEKAYASVLGLSLEELKQLKTRIYEAAVNYEPNCDISDLAIPYNSKTAEVMGDIVYKGNPEVFHIQSLSFSYRKSEESLFTRVNFARYKYEQAEYQKRLKDCRTVAADLVAGIAGSSLSQVEKALLLHDRLAVWCEYDYTNFQLGNVPEESYTLYGALINRVAVCEGYVQAYTYLLDMVGIKSYMCISFAMGHAWNIVLIDGEYYHVDVTWDDPVEDITGRVNHKNFLRSSAGIYETGHKGADYDTTPTATDYDKAFWQDSQSAFQLLDGKIYYIDSEADALKRWDGKGGQVLCEVKDTWYAGANSMWPGNYARLGSDEAYLYYSLSDAVYRYDPATGKTKTAYTPKISGEYYGIYGFTVEGDYFYCDIHNSPNFTPATKDEMQIKYPYRTTQQEPEGARGDVDGDNTITSTDARMTLQYYTGKIGEDQLSVTAADVDKDGSITSTDARLVLQYYAGKITAWP